MPKELLPLEFQDLNKNNYRRSGSDTNLGTLSSIGLPMVMDKYVHV